MKKKKLLRMLSFLTAFTLLFTSVFTVSAEESKTSENQGTCDADATEYAIYPIPQSISYEEDHGSFELSDSVAIVAEAGVDTYTKAFLKEVLDEYGVSYTEETSIQKEKSNILLGIEGSDEVVDIYADENITIADAELYAKNDAYMLDAGDGCIIIEGKDTDSVFYGVATLQMMFSSFAGEKFLNAHIEDYATVATRGYIEGFYGAWEFDEREDLMKFARDYKMNSYVYAAKGDEYHTSKWAEPYPTETLKKLERLVEEGKKTKVEFAWSIHLGSFFSTFLSTSDANYATQYAKLTAKLDQLIGIGVTKIDVLNDDFGSGSHETVVEVLNQINAYLKSNGCEPLTYCPQGYNKSWSGDGTELEALKNLDSDINIYWTGDDVNSPITQSTVDYVTEKSEHTPDYWLNYPVNEHAKSGVFLGDITYYARDNVTGLAGFHSNPSRYAYSNEVGLYQLAALVWNNNYSEHAQEIWESAFDYLQPEVKDSYFKIASNISNAPNSSRVSGFNESEYLADAIEAVKEALDSGDSLKANAEAQAVLQEFKDIVAAIADFRENCANQDLVAELDPWLSSLDDLAHAGQDAIESLIALEENDPSLAWEELSSASKYYDTAYTYTNEAGNIAQAGSKRLYPFVATLINSTKNGLTPILNPSDNTVSPVLYAKLGGTERSADANGLKMYDGDESTVAVWNVVQQQGDYFGLDLGRVITVTDITILQGNTDTDHDIFHQAVLQYSEDGENWVNLEDAVVETDGHSIKAEGLSVKARYVRYYLEETGYGSKQDYWTHVREFAVNKEVEEHDRIYTNVETFKETPLTFERTEVSVRGLENIILKSGEYVGIKLAEPTAVTDFTKEGENLEGLTFQYSYNEEVWMEAGQLEEAVGVKYLRLINQSDTDVELSIDKIGMNLKNLQADPSMLTTTTAGLSEGDYTNVFDGDLTSYILTSGGQAQDTYITFDLGKTIEVYDVTAVTTDGNQRFYNAKIQISQDNASWTDVAVVESDNSVFEVPYRYVNGDGEGEAARYLRIYFTGTNSNALKLHEIQINTEVAENIAASQIVSSMSGNTNALADKDISTLFAATAEAGDYIEYRISENTNVTQVSVLQGQAGNGKLYVTTASGEKVELGTLNQSVSVFDTTDEVPITAIRIEWSGTEEVAIHELGISTGTNDSTDIGEYVEPIIIAGESEAPITNIAQNGVVYVSGTSDGNKDNVIDGDTSTKWDSNHIKSGTQDTDDAWIYIDLGDEKEYEISQIVVRYFNKIYPTSWVIQSSDDAVEWTDVTETMTKADNGATHPVETIDFATPFTARYVRLYFNTLNTAAAGNGIGITEYEIYGREKKAVDKSELEELIAEALVKAESANYTVATKAALASEITAAQAVADNNAATTQNVADALEALQSKVNALQMKIMEQQNIGLGKTVTVSGTSNGVKESINDGDSSSKWDSDLIKGPNKTSDEAWFVIDLGTQANLIDELRVSYFNKVYPTQYEVQISNDGANWTTVETLSREHNGATYPVDEIVFETPVSARYIKMLFTEMNEVAAGHGIGINEAEVLGRYIYENAQVTETASYTNITVQEGEAFDESVLAKLATIQIGVEEMEQEITAIVPVVWNTDGIDVNTPATYSVNGQLSLNGIENADAVQATVDVIVNAKEPEQPELKYTALDEQLDIAEKAIVKDDYTPNSYTAFETAYNQAKDVRENAISQEEIDNAAAALKTAIDTLVVRADKSALEGKLEEAAKFEAEKDTYTSETYAVLEEAILAAKQVKEDSNATQEQVTEVVAALEAGIQQLVKAEPETPDDPENPDEPENPDKPENPDEPAEPEKPQTPENPDGTQTPSKEVPEGDTSVQTGDQAEVIGMFVMMLFAAACGIAVFRKKFL